MSASDNLFSPQAVASLPPPGLGGPAQATFSPRSATTSTKYLAFLSASSPIVRSIESPPIVYRPLTEIYSTTANTTSSNPQPEQRSSQQHTAASERVLMCMDLSSTNTPEPLLRVGAKRRMLPRSSSESLEERLRRERQRLSVTQFSWVWTTDHILRVLLPARGMLLVQDVGGMANCVLEGNTAVDPQLSPDGSMLAWTTAEGDMYVKAATAEPNDPAIRITYGNISTNSSIRHGVAEFCAVEEMDRHSGFWWNPQSNGILFTQVDESHIPVFRVVHDQQQTHHTEEYRYPFAGQANPNVTLGYVQIDKSSIRAACDCSSTTAQQAAESQARSYWKSCAWFDPPREATEYLARVHWLDAKAAVAQWQNRAQTVSVWYRMDLLTSKGRTMLVERSSDAINLHHLFRVLPRPIHPDECTSNESNLPPLPQPLPPRSVSFLLGSERTGFAHLYLYTFVPQFHGEQAVLIKTISSGDWMVENLLGVDMNKDLVYFTGTFDSVLERHLYALPLRGYNKDEGATSGEADQHSAGGVRRGLSKVFSFTSSHRSNSSRPSALPLKPIRLTQEPGMHSIVMDDDCNFICDTCSDVDRPPSMRVYKLPEQQHHLTFSASESRRESIPLMFTLYDALHDDKLLTNVFQLSRLPAPEIRSFPSPDGSETLYYAIYRPDPRIHGPGPYPLVNSVYGGPNVQRVHRSWSLTADMRAQRLARLGFLVVKCDNRGSSRRGVAFERAISRRLGRVEVLDQVAAVRQLTLVRGIADPNRVGIYGWSYGGYLAAMCLMRAPDVFHVAVAGAPVTSWEWYDTHYTERYMGTPSDNPTGYRESSVLDHVPNMRGNLMIVHGLVDENVHFRHTSKLINKLTASNREYTLQLFPNEGHSPRRFRDRVYMEQHISEYFVRHLNANSSAIDVAQIDVSLTSSNRLHSSRCKRQQESADYPNQRDLPEFCS
jgi:dipeptidyl-peptidase-4